MTQSNPVERPLAPNSRPDQHHAMGQALAYVTLLFFAWGFVTAMIDPLVPAVRKIFALSYTESLLTQFAFFIAYGIVSLPAAALLARLGNMNAILLALATMILGCILMPIATHAHLYVGVLAALFTIAAGITLLQVAANPLAASLGDPKSSHFRLTLTQALNSLGTFVAPFVGALLLLKGGVFGAGSDANSAAAQAESLRRIDFSFLLIAGFILLLGMFLWSARKRIQAAAPPLERQASPFQALTSLWACLGAGAIFLYVGAEVAIGSIMINFLGQPNILHSDAEHAGKLLSFYWGGAMVGRFVGSGLLARFPAGMLLGLFALIAAGLCGLTSQSGGQIAAICALSIGLFNSIMFPTIFTITLQRSTAPASATSGLLCMAIVGGAVLPLLAGQIADTYGLSMAFLLPALAYLTIAAFAFASHRKGEASPDQPGTQMPTGPSLH